MSKIQPLSLSKFYKNLPLNKVKKVKRLINYRRNNKSSLSSRNSYNNPKLFKSNSMASVDELKKKPKLFSLLDINYKITYSRGTSIPDQYKRYTDDEQQKIFSFPYRIDGKLYSIKSNNEMKDNNNNSENGKNCVNKKIKRCKSSENTMKLHNNFFKEKENMKGDNKTEKFNITGYKFYNCGRNKIVNDNSKKNYRSLNLKKNPMKISKGISINSSGEIMKTNKSKIFEDSKEDIRLKKDRWLPKGYDYYEKLIKNPKLFNKKLKIEYSMKKSISSKLMKEKSYNSDIFFFKTPSEKELTNKNLNECRNFQNSDIFNMKNDPQNISKSGESYLFRNDDKIKYSVSQESNSFWKISDNKFPTLANYTSKEYNILNPGKKAIAFTKERIMMECENKKDKNSKMINNVNYMNPIYKQKGLTEYIDLTRNGASNIGKDYMNSYNNNPKCFYKRNNIATAFYDIHFQYKSICQKPFVKNFFD